MKISPLAILLLFAGSAWGQDWTWLRGSTSNSVAGTYGTQGVSNSANDPGGRHGSATWTDKQGNLWLFGGEGYTGTANLCWLNDLWKYNKSNNEWTWVRGSNGPNSSGSYGTMGVSSPANDPPAREFSMAWTDTAGKFWLFGGDAYDSGTLGARQAGDLWKYDPATNQWTWVKGYNTFDQGGVYNTMGTPNSANLPGCRNGGATWVDANNNLWLFGGRGWDASTSFGFLNDLWRYNPSTNQWTWIKGGNSILQVSSFGTMSVTASTNQPGGRGFSGVWQTTAGDVYIFGGAGYVTSSSSVTVQNRLGDLWKYQPSSNNWTWMNGSSLGNQNGNYGTKGIPAPAVQPGARESAATWVDATGKLWMFGGLGYPGQGLHGLLNDLFSYSQTTGLWTWVKGDTITDVPGIYGTQGVASPSNKPGAREYNTFWRNTGSQLYLFGGLGVDDTTIVDANMNDLWLLGVPCNPDSVNINGNALFCNGQTATLSIMPIDNSAVTWYSSLTSTVALGSGTSFVTPTLSASGSDSLYTYYVSVATCSQSPRTAVTITALPSPTLFIAVPQVACENTPMSFTASGAQTYTWNPGASVSAVHTVTLPAGGYTTIVTGTDSNGCTATETASVTVNPNPQVSIAGPTAACAGSTITFTASGASNYNWSNGSSGTTCSMIVGPSGFTMICGGEDLNGCEDTEVIVVSALPVPTLTAKASASVVCINNVATFTAAGASSYSWSSGQTTSVMTHTASTYTTYSFTVTGTGTNGCSSTATVSYLRSECIGINENQDALALHIYPNPSEGTFFIETSGLSAKGVFTIVNNLGQLVWSKNLLLEENKFEVNLPSGLYHCAIKTNEGRTYQSKLIVR